MSTPSGSESGQSLSPRRTRANAASDTVPLPISRRTVKDQVSSHPAALLFGPSGRHRRLLYGPRELTRLTIRVGLVALLAAVALFGIYAMVTNF